MRETYCLESTVARPKLKGLAGYLTDWWNMPFNAIIREEPYHGYELKGRMKAEVKRGKERE